jgi:uncharacterized protein (TIRG00374 family)
MNRKRALVTAVVVLVLVALAYLQFRTWRAFDWGTFFRQIENVRVPRLIAAVAIIYGGYVLRAMRWSVMLKPVKPVPWSSLLAPMFIGFTGLAILGRPGEFIRPYLIARQERLTVSSQMGVWTVERIFDMGTFAVLVALDLIFAPTLRQLPYFAQFRRAGFLLSGFIFLLGVITFFIWRNGVQISSKLQKWLSPISQSLAENVSGKIRAFGVGLHTIHDIPSFLQLLALSFALWLSIAYAYLQVTRAFHGPLQHMGMAQVILLMGFSIAGSAVQLPVVGGGSQLATITALVHIFDIPGELAVSCGVLLWLVTFVAATPVGLSLARHAHVSIAKLSEEAKPA